MKLSALSSRADSFIDLRRLEGRQLEGARSMRAAIIFDENGGLGGKEPFGLLM
jgi:hypothetical protein